MQVHHIKEALPAKQFTLLVVLRGLTSKQWGVSPSESGAHLDTGAHLDYDPGYSVIRVMCFN